MNKNNNELNAIQQKRANLNKATQEGSKQNLTDAKNKKNDEFYTRYEDIEKEMRHYKKLFEGKIIFMNCDDPLWSNFWMFFEKNFKVLKIKKLISTHYRDDGNPSYALMTFTKDDGTIAGKKIDLKENGDFRSEECIEFLKEADIVITNPPFSLFREYIDQLIKYKKKFIILGNNNALSYKETFKLIKNNKIWLGNSGIVRFFIVEISKKHEKYNLYMSKAKKILEETKTSSKIEYNVGGGCWLTNMGTPSDKSKLILTEKYEGNEDKYADYINFDAININSYKDIPYDYSGVMGVPITALHKFGTDQFEIIALGVVGSITFTQTDEKMYIIKNGERSNKIVKNGKGNLYYEITKDKASYEGVESKKFYKAPFARILIKNKEINGGNNGKRI